MIRFNLSYSPFKRVNHKDLQKDLEKNTQVMQTGDYFQCLQPSIRPKDMDAVRCILSFDPTNIVLDLIYTAGLGTRNNIIIDADTGQPIPYGNKLMVYPINSLLITPNSDLINFDPIFNLKMMEIVLTIWITKYGSNISSSYINGLPNGTKFAEAKYNNAKVVTSASYMNDTMALIDLLFILDGGIDVIRPNLIACDQYLTNVKLMKGRRYE